MYTYTSCMQCQIENGVPNFGSTRLERIPDDGVIELVCDRGHRTFTIIQQAKYEILSELAVVALHDGYYREAVASFASSLERIYEYYIDLICRHRGIVRAEFESAWKPLQKLSERQFGAFLMLYLLENGKPFQPLHQKHTEFRNKVIHTGKIPSRAEAIGYGQAVGECALPLISLINSEKYFSSRQELTFESLFEKSQKARKAGVRSSTLAMPTPFGFSPPSDVFNLEGLLQERAKRPDMTQAVKECHALSRLLAKNLPASEG